MECTLDSTVFANFFLHESYSTVPAISSFGAKYTHFASLDCECSRSNPNSAHTVLPEPLVRWHRVVERLLVTED
jgi:hypothetical protein